MRALTKRQRDVLDFIVNFVNTNRYSPTFDEIGAGVGLSSLSTVYKHVDNLEEKGFIQRDYNRSRSIEVLPDGKPLRRETVHCRNCGAEVMA